LQKQAAKERVQAELRAQIEEKKRRKEEEQARASEEEEAQETEHRPRSSAKQERFEPVGKLSGFLMQVVLGVDSIRSKKGLLRPGKAPD
jgi:hypothetical protein